MFLWLPQKLSSQLSLKGYFSEKRFYFQIAGGSQKVEDRKNKQAQKK